MVCPALRLYGGRLAIASALMVVLPRPAYPQWGVEFFLGTAINVPMPLTIHQDGYPDISFTGHYAVRPFDSRIYYAWRVSHWGERRGWIVEHLHHKMYLENPNSEVAHYEVTHGYNLLTLNRGFRWGGSQLMVGGGAVLASPHSTIRGLTWSQERYNYYWSGVGGQVAASHRFTFGRHLFATVEGKATAAWAGVPVVDGRAHTPNIAFHALAGGGVQF